MRNNPFKNILSGKYNEFPKSYIDYYHKNIIKTDNTNYSFKEINENMYLLIDDLNKYMLTIVNQKEVYSVRRHVIFISYDLKNKNKLEIDNYASKIFKDIKEQNSNLFVNNYVYFIFVNYSVFNPIVKEDFVIFYSNNNGTLEKQEGYSNIYSKLKDENFNKTITSYDNNQVSTNRTIIESAEDLTRLRSSLTNKKTNTLKRHIIYPNQYLGKETLAYYKKDYVGYRVPNNPDFINTLKNTFGDENPYTLNNAKDEVIKILKEDIKEIVEENSFYGCSIVCVPRAKHDHYPNQLYFLKAVKEAANEISGVVDATNAITRRISTKTTHLKNSEYFEINNLNQGDVPYPGITKKTCNINQEQINNKNIILVDDIYTPSVNIDEDAIQALYDFGAKNIIFYSIAMTKRRERNYVVDYDEIF